MDQLLIDSRQSDFNLIINGTGGYFYDNLNRKLFHMILFDIEKIIFNSEGKIINYPYEKINYMKNYLKNRYCQYIWNRVPYTLVPLDKINDYYELNIRPEMLIDQELVNYRRGLLILQRIRLCHLLKKISYKYWYEDLNKDGLSRMCLKDMKDLKL